MALSYNSALKQTRMNAVTAAIDADPDHEGVIEIGNGTAAAFGTLLCSIDLQDPSFSASSPTGTINMAGAPLSGYAVAGGRATIARIMDGGGTSNYVVTGLTVGDSTTDPVPEIVLNSVEISAGQTVTLTSGTFTHAP